MSMALSVGELTVNIRLDSSGLGEGLAEFRREVETSLVKSIRTRALPALQALRKLLMSAVRTALRSVATFISTRLLRALLAMTRWLKRTAGPILYVSRLLRAYLLPALLALARDSRKAATGMATAVDTAAAVIAARIGVLVFHWDWLARVALGSATTMAIAWHLAIEPIPLVAAAIIGLTALIQQSWQNLVSVTVSAFATIVLTITTAWQLVAESTLLMWTMIVTTMQAALTAITIAVLTTWQLVFDSTVASFTLLWTFILTIWTTIVTTVLLATTTIYINVVTTWQLILESTVASFTALWTFLQTIWTIIVTMVLLALATIYASVVVTWQLVVATTVNSFTQILNEVTRILVLILLAVVVSLVSIILAFQLLRILPEFVQGIFQGINDIVVRLLGELAAKVAGQVADIVGKLSKLTEAIRELGSESLDSSWKVGLFAAAVLVLAAATFILAAAMFALGVVLRTSGIGEVIGKIADAIKSVGDAINNTIGLVRDFIGLLEKLGSFIGGLFGASSSYSMFVGVGDLSAVAAPRSLALAAVGPAPGADSSAYGIGRTTVLIENFYATPSQSPADIAAELDWMSRGGG